MIRRKISARPQVSTNRDDSAFLRICLSVTKINLSATNTDSFHDTLTDSEISLEAAYKEYIEMAIFKGYQIGTGKEMVLSKIRQLMGYTADQVQGPRLTA